MLSTVKAQSHQVRVLEKDLVYLPLAESPSSEANKNNHTGFLAKFVHGSLIGLVKFS